MKIFRKILFLQLTNVIRSKWVIFYLLSFLIITEGLFKFGGSGGKAIVSLLNISLLLIPIISIVFGTIYVYNSREFIELLLCQPVKRSHVYSSLYLGLVLPLGLSFLIGVGLPFLIEGNIDSSVIWVLLISGFMNTAIFIGFALILALKFDDKSMGIGMALLLWFFLAVIYDGIIMFVVWQFSDYPLESTMIGMSIINPIDLGRIMVMLKFDVAALMGYTGALFEKFFGGFTGLTISFGMMILWTIVPFFIGLKIFKNKNF